MGHETVLLVEDEGPLRMIAREFLKASGYQVIEAPSGAEALQLAGAHAGAIDLVLTDVVMPEMSGRILADRLAAERPGIRVLFMSGYTDDAIVHHGVLEPGRSLIVKPFTREALARRVREVLDQVAGRKAA